MLYMTVSRRMTTVDLQEVVSRMAYCTVICREEWASEMDIQQTGGVSRLRAAGGFSLIELMIVVAIVAVLLSVALPAFQNEVIRGRRAAVQGEMLDLANRQEQYLIATRTYAATKADLSYTDDPDLVGFYTITLENVDPAGPTFTIKAVPSGSQVSSGGTVAGHTLTLNEQGVGMPAEFWDR